MKIKWIITPNDLDLIKEYIGRHEENNFVKNRIRRNLSDDIPDFTKEEFWKWMIACLLTTQQRSGPTSNISRFLIFDPFPLSYGNCINSENVGQDSFKILSEFGGIRRTTKISEEIEYNLFWLEEGGWAEVIEIAHQLLDNRKDKPSLKSILLEREACLIVQKLKGIGPKQSRNLWQALGLTRLEIPLDSRIIKWLNINEFPFKLSTIGLSDENYYQFVMDGIQRWCAEADIMPCLLDAAIFSSYDDEWPEDYKLW